MVRRNRKGTDNLYILSAIIDKVKRWVMRCGRNFLTKRKLMIGFLTFSTPHRLPQDHKPTIQIRRSQGGWYSHMPVLPGLKQSIKHKDRNWN